MNDLVRQRWAVSSYNLSCEPNRLCLRSFLRHLFTDLNPLQNFVEGAVNSLAVNLQEFHRYLRSYCSLVSHYWGSRVIEVPRSLVKVTQCHRNGGQYSFFIRLGNWLLQFVFLDTSIEIIFRFPCNQMGNRRRSPFPFRWSLFFVKDMLMTMINCWILQSSHRWFRSITPISQGNHLTLEP